MYCNYGFCWFKKNTDSTKQSTFGYQKGESELLLMGSSQTKTNRAENFE